MAYSKKSKSKKSKSKKSKKGGIKAMPGKFVCPAV